MINRNTLLILLVLVVAVVAAAVGLRRDPAPEPAHAGAVFPDLMTQINQVTALTGSTNEGSFTIKRQDGRWVVENKSDYPADPSKVRQALIGFAELERVEPKTSNPELYEQLDVQDVSTDGAGSLQLTLEGDNGDILASLIVGKRGTVSAADVTEWYVRAPEEEQAWLVRGSLSSDKTVADWLDKNILKFGPARVREVRVRHADGEVVAIRRANAGETDYELMDMPADAEVDSQWGVNTIATTFSELTLEDVVPVATIESANSGLSVEVTTFDGLQIQLKTMEVDDQSYATLQARFEPSLVTQASAEEPAAAVEADADTATDTDTENKTDDDSGTPVEEEVDALNARWQGWAYVLPEHSLDNIAIKQAELIKTPGEDEAAAQSNQ